MLIRTKRLMFNGADPEGGGGTPPTEPTQPASTSEPKPTEGGGEVDYKAKYEEALQHSRTWESRAKDNKGKADQFDQLEESKKSEIQKEREAREKAEAQSATSAAELLQLRFANEHSITKDERPLLTATSEEALQAQIDSILKLRAPATASAKEAGITGGGSASKERPKSLAEAVAARINGNK